MLAVFLSYIGGILSFIALLYVLYITFGTIAYQIAKRVFRQPHNKAINWSAVPTMVMGYCVAAVGAIIFLFFLYAACMVVSDIVTGQPDNAGWFTLGALIIIALIRLGRNDMILSGLDEKVENITRRPTE